MHKPEIGEWSLQQALDLHARFHGTENGRLGVQIAAHAPDTCSRRLLEQIRGVRDRLGVRVQSHLSQSKIEVERVRERDGMSPPELYDDVGLLDDKLLAAHCIHLSRDDIDRIGKAGVHVAHIAKGNQTGGTMAPTSALRRGGAKFALGTDNMHGDMIEVMRWALGCGRLQEVHVSDFWQPSTVLEMATMGGARAMGLENEIGSLEVGKKADMVILDFRRPHLVPLIDPLANLVHTAQGRDVECVIVDGRVVVQNGRLLFVDQGEILRNAQSAAENLWRRAKASI
jgi:5-methylthioadenosine/S-adenosylhomocysteine deaminase